MKNPKKDRSKPTKDNGNVPNGKGKGNQGDAATWAWERYMNQNGDTAQRKQKAGRPPEDEWPDSRKRKKLRDRRRQVAGGAGGGGAW